MDDTFRRRRRDALPEHTHYADSGCELFRACLECPFAHCQYETPGGAGAIRRGTRNTALAIAAGGDGVSAGELAAMFGLSTRTVFRVLRQHERRR